MASKVQKAKERLAQDTRAVMTQATADIRAKKRSVAANLLGMGLTIGVLEVQAECDGVPSEEAQEIVRKVGERFARQAQ